MEGNASCFDLSWQSIEALQDVKTEFDSFSIYGGFSNGMTLFGLVSGVDATPIDHNLFQVSQERYTLQSNAQFTKQKLLNASLFGIYFT